MDGNGEAREQVRYSAAISEYWDSDQLTVESLARMLNRARLPAGL